MPKYAPGTDAYDEGRERRFRREATRRQNISDLLIGGGQIMQALGAARRAREERAANDLYAQRIEQLMSGGASGPAPSSVKPPNAPWAGQSIVGVEDMVSIPQPREQSFNEQLAQDAGAGRGGFLENLKNSFTFGTGAPRLKPEHMMALWQAHEGMRQRATENQRYTDERVYQLGRDTIEDRQKKDAARAELKKWHSEQFRLIGEFESKAEQDAREEAGRSARHTETLRAKADEGANDPAKYPTSMAGHAYKWHIDADALEHRAMRVRGFNNVTIDDALISALRATKDPDDTAVASLLEPLKVVTSPEEKLKKLEEVALGLERTAKARRGTPWFQSLSNWFTNVYPNIVKGMSPASAQAQSPVSDQELDEYFAAHDIDPNTVTPDQVLEAETAIRQARGG